MNGETGKTGAIPVFAGSSFISDRGKRGVRRKHFLLTKRVFRDIFVP